jgi:hypothetical protein
MFLTKIKANPEEIKILEVSYTEFLAEKLSEKLMHKVSDSPKIIKRASFVASSEHMFIEGAFAIAVHDLLNKIGKEFNKFTNFYVFYDLTCWRRPTHEVIAYIDVVELAGTPEA